VGVACACVCNGALVGFFVRQWRMHVAEGEEFSGDVTGQEGACVEREKPDSGTELGMGDVGADVGFQEVSDLGNAELIEDGDVRGAYMSHLKGNKS